jgi:hypothetical protein
MASQAAACVLFSGAEPRNLGLACLPNWSLVLRLPSGSVASLLAPSLSIGLTDALILTASLSSKPTPAFTGHDREAGNHHQRDREVSPHAMLGDREGPPHAMLEV